MKNLYIPHHKFPPIRRQVNVMIDDKRKTFDVAVTYAATINMDDLNRYFNGETKEYPSTATAALDVALRHVAALQRNVIAVGRSVFKFDNLAKLLSPGIQAWAGFSQSARPCQFGLMLNMNSCFTPMICEEDVAHFIGSFVSQRTHSNVPIEQAHRYLTPQLYEKMANKIIKLKVREFPLRFAECFASRRKQPIIREKNCILRLPVSPKVLQTARDLISKAGESALRNISNANTTSEFDIPI